MDQVKNLPVITLLTDFGVQDEYVGVMKGVILSINSTVQLIDITHDLTRHDIMQAALVIKSAFKYFPQGSIHVIVVDPGVGGERNIICLRKEGHVFVAPDNGVLSLVIRDQTVDEMCAVTNETYFLKPVSSTFHGRDILAPVAAHLSKGLDMPSLGKEIGLSDVVTLDIPTPFMSSAGELVGNIISIDHFGNLITNIDQEALERFRQHQGSEGITIRVGQFKIQGISTSYDSVQKGVPLAIVGSRQLLEISVNQADARTYLDASIGQTVRVESETDTNP